MTAAGILIARTGERDALVIAVMPAPDSYTSGARLVVGDVHRISADGEAELWRAWLWPSPGGVMHVTQSCEAVDAISVTRLGERLRKRAGKEPWWGGEVA